MLPPWYGKRLSLSLDLYVTLAKFSLKVGSHCRSVIFDHPDPINFPIERDQAELNSIADNKHQCYMVIYENKLFRSCVIKTKDVERMAFCSQ